VASVAIDRSSSSRFTRTNAGPDGLVDTQDDAIDLWFDYAYPATDDTERIEVFYDGPGPDGVWLTTDDHSTSYETELYDLRGLLVGSLSHGTGPDGRPNTADDTTTARSSYDYDPQGEQTRWVRYSGQGSDGVWGTADDTVLEYYDSTFVDGHLTAGANFAVGPDGRPFTADDVKRSVTLYDPSL
jgi:hypothetical protein